MLRPLPPPSHRQAMLGRSVNPAAGRRSLMLRCATGKARGFTPQLGRWCKLMPWCTLLGGPSH